MIPGKVIHVNWEKFTQDQYIHCFISNFVFLVKYDGKLLGRNFLKGFEIWWLFILLAFSVFKMSYQLL